MQQNLLTFILLVFLHISKAEINDCNPSTGPSGVTECVLLEPYYSKPQMATCVTDEYMKTKSRSLNKHHQCRDTHATYCWYQCMYEVHDLDEGPVYNDCSCDPNAKPTTWSVITNTTLPSRCYSPNGTQCSWYRNCLEKRHPCRGTGNSYALDYAEHFCNLYEERMSKFSTTGQKWINGVRKCLQVSLVPILRPWNDGISCSQIKDQAFDSHSRCYVTPGSGAPSICDVGVKDLWSIFWTIKGSFTNTPLRSLTGIYEVANECGQNIFTDKDDVSLIHLDTESNIHSKNRSLPSTYDDKLVFAEKVGESIAKSMGWSESGITWFSFYSNSTNDQSTELAEETRVQVLLSSKKKFDLNAENSPEVNVSNTVQILVKAVADGVISIGNGTVITRMVGCDTSFCNSTSVDVTYEKGTTEMAGDDTSVTYSTCIDLTNENGTTQMVDNGTSPSNPTSIDVDGEQKSSKAVYVHNCGLYMQMLAGFFVLYAISN